MHEIFLDLFRRFYNFLGISDAGHTKTPFRNTVHSRAGKYMRLNWVKLTQLLCDIFLELIFRFYIFLGISCAEAEHTKTATCNGQSAWNFCGIDFWFKIVLILHTRAEKVYEIKPSQLTQLLCEIFLLSYRRFHNFLCWKINDIKPGQINSALIWNVSRV